MAVNHLTVYFENSCRKYFKQQIVKSRVGMFYMEK